MYDPNYTAAHAPPPGVGWDSLHEAAVGGFALPPPQPDAASYAHSAPAQQTYYGAPQPEIGGYGAPPEAPGRLQVLQEDFGRVAAQQPQSLRPPPPLGEAACGDVYVQNARDASRFHPVAAQRVRRAMGRTAETSVQDSDFNCTSRSIASSRSQAVSFGAPASIPSDASDIATLDLLVEVDAEVYDLIYFSKQGETFAAATFFLCQCLLAGMSIVTGLLAQGASDDVQLRNTLLIIQPGHSCIRLAMCEVALIGSILQAWETFRRLRVSDSYKGIGSSNKEISEQRNAARHLVFGAATVAVNIALLLVSLAGSSVDATISADKVEWDSETGEKARSILETQSWLAVCGAGFSLPHAMDLLATPRHVANLTPLDSSSFLQLSR